MKYDSIIEIKVYDEDIDFCTSMVNVSCPVEPGHVDFVKNIHIPNTAPRGSYSGEFRFRNGDGTELACVNLKIYL